MKDISDYFTSPNKDRKFNEALDVAKVSDESVDQNVNTTNITKIEAPESDNKANPSAKKKRGRKYSHPVEKNVSKTKCSQDLSCGNSSLSEKEKKRKKNNCEETDTLTEPILVEDNSKSEFSLESSNNVASKVNAFQFLMNSRNNVIGSNSDGKTLKEQDIDLDEHKQKLTSRKNLFKNWADQKGALKRQRDEEDIERSIGVKLEKRAKRLKKLLKVSNEVKNIQDISDLTKKKHVKVNKKRVKRLSSSDSNDFIEKEDQNDIKQVKNEDVCLSQIAEIVVENAQDNNIAHCSPVKQSQKDILNFFGVIDKEDKIEVFDNENNQKEVFKIKMFTPDSTKKRSSLLSSKKSNSEVIRGMETINIGDESSQESVKMKKHKKKKKSF